MSQVEPLPAEALRRRCDVGDLGFETTADIEPLDGVLGQARAMTAFQFGATMDQPGYNLYVLGAQDSGRHSIMLRQLEQLSRTRAKADDWVYVRRFDEPQRPWALRLPAGRGRVLRARMSALLADLRAALPAVFQAEEYRTRRSAIDEESKLGQESALEELEEEARKLDIALIWTSTGVALAPIRDGKVIDPSQFKEWPDAPRKAIMAHISRLGERLRKIVSRAPTWEKARRKALRDLDKGVTAATIGPLLDELLAEFAGLSEVQEYIETVRADLIDNVELFLTEDESPLAQAAMRALRRYEVNVLVDRTKDAGAPVVYEDQPTQPKLVGRVEHRSEMGTLVTDFTLIRPGALHRANSGYLVLDVRRVLSWPLTWTELKLALRSQRVRVESAAHMLNVLSPVGLQPDPIPLDLKVVLIGDRWLFHLLGHLDPEFSKLFKVAVDFEDDIRWTALSAEHFARFVKARVMADGLRHLSAGGVGRLLERAARLANDREKLTLRMGAVCDLAREADWFAARARSETIDASHVQEAIDARDDRHDRLRDGLQESTERNILHIETEGAAVGQINGLSVMELGNFRFGRPTRITARARLGAGKVIDIEREVELGGSIHSKGVLILAGYLGARYAPELPLSLSATLVFEQSYGGVDGDSASSAELYALLSALSGLPLRQDLAVTGAMDQCGRVQAVGGTNEKIEGFFDLCRARGLTGRQGVLIPRANREHLMLRPDVVAAAAAGTFHVYPVTHVDEGLALLTGVAAGERGPDGLFPEGTANRAVEDRLTALAGARKAFAAPARVD